tara:strand:+ start:250 stop:372 length:123 start_codon:yes stop_codon:yes gene_type:complete
MKIPEYKNINQEIVRKIYTNERQVGSKIRSGTNLTKIFNL